MKKTKEPLVSVLITAFNAGKYISEAVESIMHQTYKHIEIIVVNDGSTDSTHKMLLSLKKKYPSLTVITLQKNSGPSTASNIGLQKVRGTYIARMDADDIATADRIQKQVAFLEHNPDVVIVGGKCQLITESGALLGEKEYPITHEDIYKALFRMNPIQHPNCMINTKLLPKHMIQYHNHSLLAHDLELLFEASQYGKLANLEDITLFYRQRKNSLSLKNPKKTFSATIQVRHKAVKQYNYHPTVASWMIHFAQIAVIFFTPNSVIFPLFKFARIDLPRALHYFPSFIQRVPHQSRSVGI